MKLRKTVYSVMIISAGDFFIDSIKKMLSPSEFSPVAAVHGINEARRMLNERSYDFVIINSPLNGESGTRFAAKLTAASQTVVLIFTKADTFGEIYEEVTPSGVFTLQKPATAQSVLTALLWMIAARERLRRSEKTEVTLEKKMQDIRLMNRAKWLLIENEHCTEEQAHKHIEKQAMDRSLEKAEIAEEIIQRYS